MGLAKDEAISDNLHWFEIPSRFAGRAAITRPTAFAFGYGLKTNTGKRIVPGDVLRNTVTEAADTEVYTKALAKLRKIGCKVNVVMDYAMIIPPKVEEIGQMGWDSRTWERSVVDVVDRTRQRRCSGLLEQTMDLTKRSPWLFFEAGAQITNYALGDEFPQRGSWAKIDVYITYVDKNGNEILCHVRTVMFKVQ